MFKNKFKNLKLLAISLPTIAAVTLPLLSVEVKPIENKSEELKFENLATLGQNVLESKINNGSLGVFGNQDRYKPKNAFIYDDKEKYFCSVNHPGKKIFNYSSTDIALAAGSFFEFEFETVQNLRAMQIIQIHPNAAQAYLNFLPNFRFCVQVFGEDGTSKIWDKEFVGLNEANISFANLGGFSGGAPIKVKRVRIVFLESKYYARIYSITAYANTVQQYFIDKLLELKNNADYYTKASFDSISSVIDSKIEEYKNSFDTNMQSEISAADYNEQYAKVLNRDIFSKLVTNRSIFESQADNELSKNYDIYTLESENEYKQKLNEGKTTASTKKGLTRLELQLFLTAIAQEKAKLVENKTFLLNYLNQKKSEVASSNEITPSGKNYATTEFNKINTSNSITRTQLATLKSQIDNIVASAETYKSKLIKEAEEIINNFTSNFHTQSSISNYKAKIVAIKNEISSLANVDASKYNEYNAKMEQAKSFLIGFISLLNSHIDIELGSNYDIYTKKSVDDYKDYLNNLKSSLPTQINETKLNEYKNKIATEKAKLVTNVTELTNYINTKKTILDSDQLTDEAKAALTSYFNSLAIPSSLTQSQLAQKKQEIDQKCASAETYLSKIEKELENIFTLENFDIYTEDSENAYKAQINIIKNQISALTSLSKTEYETYKQNIDSKKSLLIKNKSFLIEYINNEKSSSFDIYTLFSENEYKGYLNSVLPSNELTRSELVSKKSVINTEKINKLVENKAVLIKYINDKKIEVSSSTFITNEAKVLLNIFFNGLETNNSITRTQLTTEKQKIDDKIAQAETYKTKLINKIQNIYTSFSSTIYTENSIKAYKKALNDLKTEIQNGGNITEVDYNNNDAKITSFKSRLVKNKDYINEYIDNLLNENYKKYTRDSETTFKAYLTGAKVNSDINKDKVTEIINKIALEKAKLVENKDALIQYINDKKAELSANEYVTAESKADTISYLVGLPITNSIEQTAFDAYKNDIDQKLSKVETYADKLIKEVTAIIDSFQEDNYSQATADPYKLYLNNLKNSLAGQNLKLADYDAKKLELQTQKATLISNKSILESLINAEKAKNYDIYTEDSENTFKDYLSSLMPSADISRSDLENNKTNITNGRTTKLVENKTKLDELVQEKRALLAAMGGSISSTLHQQLTDYLNGIDVTSSITKADFATKKDEIEEKFSDLETYKTRLVKKLAKIINEFDSLNHTSDSVTIYKQHIQTLKDQINAGPEIDEDTYNTEKAKIESYKTQYLVSNKSLLNEFINAEKALDYSIYSSESVQAYKDFLETKIATNDINRSELINVKNEINDKKTATLKENKTILKEFVDKTKAELADNKFIIDTLKPSLESYLNAIDVTTSITEQVLNDKKAEIVATIQNAKTYKIDILEFFENILQDINTNTLYNKYTSESVNKYKVAITSLKNEVTAEIIKAEYDSMKDEAETKKALLKTYKATLIKYAEQKIEAAVGSNYLWATNDSILAYKNKLIDLKNEINTKADNLILENEFNEYKAKLDNTDLLQSYKSKLLNELAAEIALDKDDAKYENYPYSSIEAYKTALDELNNEVNGINESTLNEAKYQEYKNKIANALTLQKTNKQVIDELINQAKTKDLDSYNETSSQNYYADIDAIKNDYTNSTYSRDDVDDVKNRINNAASNLKTLKSDLLDIINTKLAQDFSTFSKDSKDLYLAKINELKTYFEDTSTAINKDNFALEKQKIDALNNLLKSNKEMLLDKLNTLKSNPFNEYSDEDKATINQKIDALLQEINAKPAITNSEYDDYSNKINQILVGLVSYKDKMLTKIDDANNSLTRNKYVTTSLEKFDNDIASLKNKVTSSEAKDYNKNVYDVDEITLNNILNSLLTYTDNLLTNVKDEISQKFDANKSNYTDASKAKFNEAFNKIMKEIADKKANGDLIDKDQHDKYQKDLENLFNDLEKVKPKNKMPAWIWVVIVSVSLLFVVLGIILAVILRKKRRQRMEEASKAKTAEESSLNSNDSNENKANDSTEDNSNVNVEEPKPSEQEKPKRGRKPKTAK